MRAEVLWLAALAGGATLAFRVLPMLLPGLVAPGRGFWGRFLSATGPAAIAALAAAALGPMAAARPDGVLPLLAGTAAVLALWAWRRSVVLATLGGPLAYAAALALVA